MNTGLLKKAHFICFGHSVAVAVLIRSMLYTEVIYERRLRSMPPRACDPFTHCTRCRSTSSHGNTDQIKQADALHTGRRPDAVENSHCGWDFRFVFKILTVLSYHSFFKFYCNLFCFKSVFLRPLLQTYWKPLKRDHQCCTHFLNSVARGFHDYEN